MESQQAGEGADPKAKRFWERQRGRRGASTPLRLQQLCPCPSGLRMPCIAAHHAQKGISSPRKGLKAVVYPEPPRRN